MWIGLNPYFNGLLSVTTTSLVTRYSFVNKVAGQYWLLGGSLSKAWNVLKQVPGFNRHLLRHTIFFFQVFFFYKKFYFYKTDYISHILFNLKAQMIFRERSTVVINLNGQTIEVVAGHRRRFFAELSNQVLTSLSGRRTELLPALLVLFVLLTFSVLCEQIKPWFYLMLVLSCYCFR